MPRRIAALCATVLAGAATVWAEPRTPIQAADLFFSQLGSALGGPSESIQDEFAGLIEDQADFFTDYMLKPSKTSSPKNPDSCVDRVKLLQNEQFEAFTVRQDADRLSFVGSQQAAGADQQTYVVIYNGFAFVNGETGAPTSAPTPSNATPPAMPTPAPANSSNATTPAPANSSLASSGERRLLSTGDTLAECKGGADFNTTGGCTTTCPVDMPWLNPASAHCHPDHNDAYICCYHQNASAPTPTPVNPTPTPPPANSSATPAPSKPSAPNATTSAPTRKGQTVQGKMLFVFVAQASSQGANATLTQVQLYRKSGGLFPSAETAHHGMPNVTDASELAEDFLQKQSQGGVNATSGLVAAGAMATDMASGMAYKADLGDYTKPFKSVTYKVLDKFCGPTSDKQNAQMAALVIERSAVLEMGGTLPAEKFVYIFTYDADDKIAAIQMFGTTSFSVAGFSKADDVLSSMSKSAQDFDKLIQSADVFVPAGAPKIADKDKAKQASPLAQENVHHYQQTTSALIALRQFDGKQSGSVADEHPRAFSQVEISFVKPVPAMNGTNQTGANQSFAMTAWIELRMKNDKNGLSVSNFELFAGDAASFKALYGRELPAMNGTEHAVRDFVEGFNRAIQGTNASAMLLADDFVGIGNGTNGTNGTNVTTPAPAPATPAPVPSKCAQVVPLVTSPFGTEPMLLSGAAAAEAKQFTDLKYTVHAVVPGGTMRAVANITRTAKEIEAGSEQMFGSFLLDDKGCVTNVDMYYYASEYDKREKPTQAPNSPPTPSPPSEKKKSNTTVIVIVVISVVAVVGVAVFLVIRSRKSHQGTTSEMLSPLSSS